jgi:uncharacterized repeat protein (TIGR04138 family)
MRCKWGEGNDRVRTGPRQIFGCKSGRPGVLFGLMGNKAVPPEKEVPTLADVALAGKRYPVEAFQFVQEGLAVTVAEVHAQTGEDESHHVTGQQLAKGCAKLASHRWGLMADLVLSRWNVHSTLDFGRIVYAMVEHGLLKTRPEDRLEDFKNVFNLPAALVGQYRIGEGL